MKRGKKRAPALYRDLREVVFHAAEHFPETRFFLSTDPAMPYVTGRTLKARCGQFGAWIAHRNQVGAHIAILGPNGAAWLTAYFAVLSSGCVAVPLHLGTKAEELKGCVQRSDSVMLLYDESCAAEAETLRAAIPTLETYEYHALLDTLSSVKETAFLPLGQEDPAALYFTSGTTAQSRCVILTHRNMGSHCTAAMNALPLSPKDAGLSVLPPSHTFEIMTNIVGALHCGGTLYINENLLTVKANMKKYEPTILVVVPLVLQMVHKEILKTAKRQGKLELLQKGMRLNRALQRFGIDISRRLFGDVYAVLGGNLRYFLCGGAALDVFEKEPFTKPDSPLYQMDNVILTRHVASQTEEAIWATYQKTIDITADFFAGRELLPADLLTPKHTL